MSAAARFDIAELAELCMSAERSDIVAGHDPAVVAAGFRTALPAGLRSFAADRSHTVAGSNDMVAEPEISALHDSGIAQPAASSGFDLMGSGSEALIDIVPSGNSENVEPEAVHFDFPDPHGVLLRSGYQDDCQSALQRCFAPAPSGMNPGMPSNARRTLRPPGDSCMERSSDEPDCGPIPFCHVHRRPSDGGIRSG